MLAICKQAEELWEKNNKSEGRDQEFYHLAERGLPYREIVALPKFIQMKMRSSED